MFRAAHRWPRMSGGVAGVGFVLIAVAVASACAGTGSEGAGGGAPGAAVGPGGTTPSDAGAADGRPTTTDVLSGPGSTAPSVSALALGAPGKCTAGAVSIAVEDDGGEAGHHVRRVVLTNTGTDPCTVTGYPGVSLHDAADHQLGAPATREPLPTPTVTLAPGSSASAFVDEQPAGLFPAEVCGPPVAVASVVVIIPDDTVAVPVKTGGEACPNAVGQLSVRPLQAGRDSQP